MLCHAYMTLISSSKLFLFLQKNIPYLTVILVLSKNMNVTLRIMHVMSGNHSNARQKQHERISNCTVIVYDYQIKGIAMVHVHVGNCTMSRMQNISLSCNDLYSWWLRLIIVHWDESCIGMLLLALKELLHWGTHELDYRNKTNGVCMYFDFKKNFYFLKQVFSALIRYISSFSSLSDSFLSVALHIPVITCVHWFMYIYIQNDWMADSLVTYPPI